MSFYTLPSVSMIFSLLLYFEPKFSPYPTVQGLAIFGQHGKKILRTCATE